MDHKYGLRITDTWFGQDFVLPFKAKSHVEAQGKAYDLKMRIAKYDRFRTAGPYEYFNLQNLQEISFSQIAYTAFAGGEIKEGA